MSVVLMPQPLVARSLPMSSSYTLSSAQLALEHHDHIAPRMPATQRQCVQKEAQHAITTANDTTMTSNTAPPSARGHIKVGSSMILSMQSTLPMSRTACSDLLLRGYLRIHHRRFFKLLPIELIPILIDFLDPLLRWCLEQQSPQILVRSTADTQKPLTVNALILKKNDWRRISISTKYIVHDHIVCTASTPYTISVRECEHIGSNLNDISWLCRMISSNASLRSLRLSHCRFLCEFSRWHYLMHHGFLSDADVVYGELESVRVDGHAMFDDECFFLLLEVIRAKCPALRELSLARTEVSDESVKALVKFMEEEREHPLWSVDIEFCGKVGDEGLQAMMGYLRRHPRRRVYFKCTSVSGWGMGGQERDERMSVSRYPT